MVMSSSLEIITAQAYFFICGIADALSIHKTLPLLVNDSTIALLTLQILAVNTVLLLGSIAIFNHGISPMLTGLNDLVLPEEGDPHLPNSYMSWFLYQSFWLAPICLLCFALSTGWYQSLADRTFKYLRKTARTSSASRMITDSIYSSIVWLCVFLQVQLLIRGIPIFHSALKMVGVVLVDGMSPSRLLPQMVPTSVTNCYDILSTLFLSITKFAGLCLMSILYGWYGWDPIWIAEGVLPDMRYNTIHEHWAYFLGFGFPYVVMLNITSFFTGYGLFLAFFPFHIMLGAVSDFSAPYRSRQFGNHAVPVEFFGPAKSCSKYVLKTFEKYYRGFRKPKKV